MAKIKKRPANRKRSKAQIYADHFSCLNGKQILEMDWMINSRSMSYGAIAERMQNEWGHYTLIYRPEPSQTAYTAITGMC